MMEREKKITKKPSLSGSHKDFCLRNVPTWMLNPTVGCNQISY